MVKTGKGEKERRAEKESAQGREAEASQRLGQGAALGAKRLLSPDLVGAPGPALSPLAPQTDRGSPGSGPGRSKGTRGGGGQSFLSLFFFFLSIRPIQWS